ncbi:hypothetical protein G6L29_15545 [Agrobacterium rhizogenes]|uniref:DUF5677 domain-containing protein n=1 Tax=Rhizobium rhizogenes TaxID=359 RepID=UPI0015728EDA|nr:DUF5677 domain-containing protein [Rhizobium rhizogenes]NTI17053.1 hypothetical protein [Rhizobium rhizogenes]
MTDEEEYDLQAVVDDGNLGVEPSESYRESLDVFDNVVRECMYVSKSYRGVQAPTMRHFYASVLFTVLVTRGISLLTLAPHTPWADKKIEHWDYASLTGITRTMIELRIAFYYLCAEECSEDEWDCRWNLFNLHDCVSRIRMFDALGDTEEVQGFKVQADELRDRLTSNPFFNGLDAKRHKKLLHGQTAYLFPLEEIAERASIAIGHFRWLYVLFSSHVHGLPMSFYRLGGDNPERGRGLPSPVEDYYSSLCLSLASTLLVSTRDELHHLFVGLRQPLEETSVDEAAEEAVRESLQVGGTASFDATDDIQMVFTRTAKSIVDTAYVYRPTGEVILERSDSDEDGAELKWFEPVFWAVSLNGKPATERALIKAMEKPRAFRIDHIKHAIIFKTDEPASPDSASSTHPI